MRIQQPASEACSANLRAVFSHGEAVTLRELIDARAAASAEAGYLVSPETGRAVNYRELQAQTRALVARLQELGLSAGDKVAFLMDNGLFTAELFLGVMYGGMVAVPLNVRAGVAQLAYMVEHCDARVVFVAGEYAGLMSEVLGQVRRPVQVIAADGDEVTALEGTVPEPLRAEPGPEDAALLMYTSGSTGHPKAAVHTHRTLLAHGRNSVCSHQLTAADRSLLVLPLYHINAECVTLIPTLLSGGSVVIPHKFSISHYWDWLEKYQCTWSAIVPTIVSQLLDWQDPRAEQRGSAFGRIRFLRSSSAPLAPSLHREFLQKFPLLLIQAMGSSEGGNIFSNPLPPGENKIGSPGLPWGFEVRVVDREGKEVAEGQAGEMLIRGEGLAQVYYKEAEATAAAFDGEGWWHTGDLAYRDADGYFFVVGRSKELIIKGGVNIAPRQVDDVLESHPAVLEAAAVGVPDRLLGEDVVAFVVLRAGGRCEERELLSFCQGRLGPFKTPTRIHFVEDLPKGPSGKVQRLRLVEEAVRPEAGAGIPQGFALGRGSDRGDEAATLPQSLGAMIGTIWADLLRVPEVGEHENFFALGGDSLLAIQCVSRLRDKTAIGLTLTDFFAHGTVAELAALVKARFEAGRCEETAGKTAGQGGFQLQSAAGSEPIPVRDRSVPYQLSTLQQRLWFMEQLNPDLPVYNEAEAAELYGELKVGFLERALNGVIARHEALRTIIEAVDGGARAVVLTSYRLRLKQIDLSGLEAGTRQSELERLLVAEPRRPYHLQNEPAIRATLICLAPSHHVFILMMHHLICDWSSEGVMWRDLSVLYRSYCLGASAELPPASIQYGDYAVWQRRRVMEANAAEHLAFWRQNLEGLPAVLELPSDRPRPQVMSYRGARKRFRIPRKLTESFRQLGRQERKSLFALFTAAWDVLLYRYTGQEDIVLGIPLAERDRPELLAMIGFLLHTHVLRTKLDGDMTFRELAERVQLGALQLYEHRAVPFDQVVRAVQPERSLAYSPLFQVMVNWRDRDQDLSFIGLEGLRVESILAESRTCKFDLTLTLTDMGEEVWAEIEYSTDLFDGETIGRMFGHYEKLLASIVADPEKAIGKLDMLANAERSKILVEWNDTQMQIPQDLCIHELFERQVERTPEAAAVGFEGAWLSYRELNERANRLAHYLRALGVGLETLVGVCLHRSPDALAAMLGILKAGAAFVPLDPDYPSERLDFMISDAPVSFVITDTRSLRTHGVGGTRVICLDSDRALIAACKTDNPPSGAGPANIAYVMYTSGSTGTPKGVLGLHRGAANRFAWMWKNFPFKVGEVCCQKTSLSFVDSIWEVFGPLLQGVPSIIISPPSVHDTAELVEILAAHAVTRIVLVPSLLQAMLNASPELGRRLPSLKIWVSSGEALSSALCRRFFDAMPDATLLNLYGSTEVAADVTFHLVSAAVNEEALIPLGRPIDNTRLYVLDAQLQPVPVGVPGELYVGGMGLARGYCNRPDLTAQRFVADPYSDQTDARLFKTGDRVRYLPAGTLEFLGRGDRQVKIRGFRVELGEIESILRRQVGVRDAIVELRGDGDGQLVAYVVATLDLPRAEAEWRGLLEQKLPDYMIPAVWVVLPALPLSPSGKLDRKALPDPEAKNLVRRTGYVPPRNETEEKLAGWWAETLGVDRVSVHDNFFDLGGHSLNAMQLISRIRTGLGSDVPLRRLLESPTVAKFSEYLEAVRWAALESTSALPVPDTRRVEIEL